MGERREGGREGGREEEGGMEWREGGRGGRDGEEGVPAGVGRSESASPQVRFVRPPARSERIVLRAVRDVLNFVSPDVNKHGRAGASPRCLVAAFAAVRAPTPETATEHSWDRQQVR